MARDSDTESLYGWDYILVMSYHGCDAILHEASKYMYVNRVSGQLDQRWL